MPFEFDTNTVTYWCPQCQEQEGELRELEIDFSQCSTDKLVLTCFVCRHNETFHHEGNVIELGKRVDL